MGSACAMVYTGVLMPEFKDAAAWIEEGDRPLPRRIMITSKWEGGSPRFVANLSWEIDPQFEPGLFDFKAPGDATKIDFITGSSQ